MGNQPESIAHLLIVCISNPNYWLDVHTSSAEGRLVDVVAIMRLLLTGFWTQDIK